MLRKRDVSSNKARELNNNQDFTAKINIVNQKNKKPLQVY